MAEMTIGRRERKKAATRRALAEAALRLFLERGYDQVTVRDIAEAADVSTTTLFKHFPGKEALVFDEAAENEAALISAVRDREPGQSIFSTLRDFLVAGVTGSGGDSSAFFGLVESTPDLRAYSHRIWMRYETALAGTIAEQTGAPAGDVRCGALAHFILETRNLARGQSNPRHVIESAFELLEHGWDSTASTA
jgi:AcrR family transcriptional regulator